MTGPAKTAEIGSEPGKLLVFHRGALGDILLALPFLAALPRHFDCSGLTLVGNSTYLNILSNQPFVGAIFDDTRAWLTGFYSDTADVSSRIKSIIRSHSGAVVFSKNESDPLVSRLKALGLKQVMSAPSRPPGGRNIHLTDFMFLSTGVASLDETQKIRPEKKSIDTARRRLDVIFGGSRPWIALSPGSGGAYKNWPLKNWIYLANDLQNQLKISSLFILGPAEAHMAEAIEKDYGMPAVKKMPLETVAALLSLSELYISNDSGLTHLAAAVEARVIAIFGATDPNLWGPRGPLVKILNKGKGTEKWPSVETVLGSVKQSLK